ncbi:hypothetical protein D3C76_1679430 [compost metagenome]
MASCRDSGSRLPKPSSMNSDSIFSVLDAIDARPRASASETRKVSPPDSECTERSSSPISVSITSNPSMLPPRLRR